MRAGKCGSVLGWCPSRASRGSMGGGKKHPLQKNLRTKPWKSFMWQAMGRVSARISSLDAWTSGTFWPPRFGISSCSHTPFSTLKVKWSHRGNEIGSLKTSLPPNEDFDFHSFFHRRYALHGAAWRTSITNEEIVSKGKKGMIICTRGVIRSRALSLSVLNLVTKLRIRSHSNSIWNYVTLPRNQY